MQRYQILFRFSQLYTKETKTVNIDQNFQGYVTPSKYGLVVVQEWWGLNQSICRTADIMSEKYGFRCIVPDLYHGEVAKDQEDAGHRLEKLNWVQALKDIEKSAEYLKNNMNCQKIGIMGFCMGGALSIAAMTQTNIITAAVPFYGIPDLKHFQLSKTNGPIFAQFGANDTIVGFSSPSDVENFKNHAVKSTTYKVEAKSWSDVGHAFCNQDRPEVYNQKVAEQAFEKAAKFLYENLR